MRICICTPNSFGYVQQEYLMSIFGLQQHFNEWQRASGRTDTLSIIMQGGLQLDQMRNDAVQTALDSGQTHILFLDADMAFPRNMLQLLIEDFEDNPEVEAVTGIYTWKSAPYLPHVYPRWNQADHAFTMAASIPLDDLFEVEGAGTGCLMIKADVFRRTAFPWFAFTTKDLPEFADRPEPPADRPRPFPIGEDLYFCLKAKPYMLCDPRIRCKHYRLESFGLSDYIKENNIDTNDNGMSIDSDKAKTIASIHSNELGTIDE